MRVERMPLGCGGRGLLRFVRRARAAVVVFVVAAAAGACDDTPAGPQLETETFIDVMVKLRRAQTWETTPAEFEARRAEILAEAGVTDSLLVQWARVRADDVTFMAAVWDSINARLMAAEDTAS